MNTPYRHIASFRRKLGNALRGPLPGGRVFGVGAAKTGTHTIGEMFADRVASAHEKNAEKLIELLLGEGPGSSGLRHFLKRRDRENRLHIDASQVNIYLIEDYLDLFPDSRFILTVRSPALWLRSIIDDSLRRETSSTWHRFRDFRFGPKADSEGPEAALGAAGLYRIDGYLKYWAHAATEVTRQVPQSQLLIVLTEDIGPRAREIATFARVPDPDRPPALTHAFANPVRSGLLDGIPRAHLEARLDAVAGPVARQCLPGWTAATDLDAILAASSEEGRA